MNVLKAAMHGSITDLNSGDKAIIYYIKDVNQGTQAPTSSTTCKEISYVKVIK
jgi:hypothetical protein